LSAADFDFIRPLPHLTDVSAAAGDERKLAANQALEPTGPFLPDAFLSLDTKQISRY
jgi:hypothetical protein